MNAKLAAISLAVAAAGLQLAPSAALLQATRRTDDRAIPSGTIGFPLRGARVAFGRRTSGCFGTLASSWADGTPSPTLLQS